MALGNDKYSLFDDGGSGPGCLPESTEHPARASSSGWNPASPPGLTLDEPTRTSPRSSPGSRAAPSCRPTGHARRLGQRPRDHPVQRERRRQDGPHDHGPSYRGVRYAWNGQPLTEPSVASPGPAGATIWASWNGATRPLSGRCSVARRRCPGAGGQAGREDGFETASPRSYRVVAVEALAAGRGTAGGLGGSGGGRRLPGRSWSSGAVTAAGSSVDPGWNASRKRSMLPQSGSRPPPTEPGDVVRRG